MNPVIFLIIASFALAHANVGKYDLNAVEAKNEHQNIDFQSTIPSIVESSTGKSSQKTNQYRLHPNKMDKSSIHEDKLSQMTSPGFSPQEMLSTGSPVSQHSRIGTEQSHFRSQEHFAPEATASSLPSKQENFGPHQAQFYDREQGLPNQAQFHDGRHRTPEHHTAFKSRQPEMTDQEFYGSRQPEFYGERPQVPEQQQFFDNVPSSRNQQQFSDDRQPSGQQEFYGNFEMGLGDQQIQSQRNFQDASNQKAHSYSSKHLTSFQSGGIQGSVRLSAFDNRQQPGVLPRSTSLHSSSVFVSGMNPLPMLPAMVYSAGPVPSTKAVVIGKGSMYQGGASVRQHLQTPYVRYVYSHLL